MHIRDLRRIRPMLDFKTASTIATSIVHSKLDYCNSLFLSLDSTQIHRSPAHSKFTCAGRHQNTQASSHYSCSSLAKNPRAHPLQSLVPNLQFPVVFPAHVNSSPSSQHALLNHHPVSPFLDPRSFLISCFPTEPYQSLHHVFGMTYHLNSAPFLRLHRRHCQLQDIIFIRLLYPSPPGLSTQN